MSTRAQAKTKVPGRRMAAAVVAVLATLGTLGAASNASAEVLTINAAGITTNGEQGNPTNTVFFFNLGVGSEVTGIGYNVNLTANAPSYLSEITVAFSSSDLTSAGVLLTPGFDQPESGTGIFSSGGIIDLGGAGLNFNVGDDGKLRVEFYEGVDDAGVNPDGIINSGTFTVQYAVVPEPSTWELVLLILGGGTLLKVTRRLASSRSDARTVAR